MGLYYVTLCDPVVSTERHHDSTSFSARPSHYQSYTLHYHLLSLSVIPIYPSAICLGKVSRRPSGNSRSDARTYEMAVASDRGLESWTAGGTAGRRRIQATAGGSDSLWLLLLLLSPPVGVSGPRD